MGKVLAGITISADGFITGPRDDPGCGLGVGGERAAVARCRHPASNASADASSTRRSLPEVGTLAQTRPMTAMLIPPASPTGALTAGSRLQIAWAAGRKPGARYTL